MKALVIFLAAGSVAVNVLLVGFLFAGRNSTPAPAPVSTSAPATGKPAAAEQADPETWNKLRTDDLPALVQRLRESGMPAEFVRAIVAAQLREIYAAREKALDPGAADRPFWKNTAVDPKVMAARSQMYREMQKTLRDLLGSDADPRDSVNALYQGRRYDSVPAEKLDEVKRLVRERDDTRNEFFSSFGGGSIMIQGDTQAKLTAIEKQHQAALAAVLSPQELEEYNLRNSDTARNLRGTLTAFNPNEQEFRTLYKLQSEFDDRFGRYTGGGTAEEQRQRSEAQRQLNEQIKAALGPTRGAEYEMSSDFQYRQTSQLVARLDLPPENTNQLWNLKKDYETRSRDVYRDMSVDPETRRQRLAALAAEATQKITPLVGGARGFEAYKQYGGWWLDNIVPRPAQPSQGRTQPPPPR